MTNERRRPDYATIIYDENRPHDRERVETITQRLGVVGILCYETNIENDGFGPGTPWLEYNGFTYFSNEIDRGIEYIINGRNQE